MFNGHPDNQVVDVDVYCPKGGNLGILPNGELCDCIHAHHAYGTGISCLSVPQQYIGKHFDTRLVPKDCGEAYVSFLNTLHTNLCAMKYVHYNCLICSPIAHSKTILAYSVLEILFKNNVPTFPVYNVLELRRILYAIDTGKEDAYGLTTDPNNLITAPYAFIKIPMLLSWEVFATMVEILDRRVRRSLSTIFIYDGYLDDLQKYDRQHILQSLSGNGTYNTIDMHNFYRLSENSNKAKFDKMLESFQL